MSTKGQVVLPKTVREGVGWKPGEVLEARVTSEGQVILSRVEGTQFQRLHGLLESEGRANVLERLLAERREEEARDREPYPHSLAEEKATYETGPEPDLGLEELKRYFWREGPDPPGYDIDEHGKHYRVT